VLEESILPLSVALAGNGGLGLFHCPLKELDEDSTDVDEATGFVKLMIPEPKRLPH
jgi:hypothetical protein